MLRSRPGEVERRFWNLADYAVRHHYCTARQVAMIARLEPARKTGYWVRHLRDLKSFLDWRTQGDDAERKHVSERGNEWSE